MCEGSDKRRGVAIQRLSVISELPSRRELTGSVNSREILLSLKSK